MKKTVAQYRCEQQFDRGRKAADIDLGLAVLSAIRQDGVPLTYETIAAACNCSRSAIYEIERRAIRKLANRLYRQCQPELREAVESILGRDLVIP